PAPDYQRNVLVGGGSIAHNPVVVDNVLYYPGSDGENLNIGYDPYGAGTANAIITGNYVVRGQGAVFSPLNTDVTMTDNSFYTPVAEPIQRRFPSNVYSGTPTSPQIFVRPNQYEPGRAHITVVNWANAASVNVDLSSVFVSGVSYEIRNAQNFFAAPVLRGTYDGRPVSIPLGEPVAAPVIGLDSPTPTDSGLAVLVAISAPPPAAPITPPRRSV